MKVIPIPCLSDNYSYLIVCEDTGQAGVVDPSDSAPVMEAVRDEGVQLVAILNTHHHWDHTGGNKDLVGKFPGLRVYGHHSDRGRIDGQTDWLEMNDEFSLGNLTVRALHNPGHTTGGVSYVVGDAVFTGDTLFAAGCGRLFEGTAAMMYRSLSETIGSLPEQTRVFFGHEYTEANLRFAQHLEPENPQINERLQKVRELRAQGRFTTPSTLAEEWQTNPFMRCDQDAVVQRVRKEDPANTLAPEDVLGVVRRMKDNF